MSHGDRVAALPPGFTALARTAEIPFAAAADPARRHYCVQFHPEVAHTPHGLAMLDAFARTVCGIADRWTAAAFVEEAVAAIGEQVGDQRVLCAVSGGVDSTVMAVLVDRAIGDRLHAVYVDTGMMREGESDAVEAMLNRQLHRPLQRVDASEIFLSRLRGVEEPERKRRIIGATFIETFTESTKHLGTFGFLAQGTLYPDRIESQSVAGPSSVIKTHHNVGGLPEKLGFALVEPLRDLFKDEVRRVGRELNIPGRPPRSSPFPRDPASRCASWARSRRSASRSCSAPTVSSSRNCGGRTSTTPSGRPARSCCRCARSASWATSARTRTWSRCGR